MYRIIFTLIIVALPAISAAQGFTPLVNLPITTGSGFNGYINSLYILSISIAALLAVIKIIIAGVKWMMTDIVTGKEQAKKDIQGAVVGLLVVLAAVLILTTINPALGTSNVTFDRIDPPNRGLGTNNNVQQPTMMNCYFNENRGISNCSAAADLCNAQNGTDLDEDEFETRLLSASSFVLLCPPGG